MQDNAENIKNSLLEKLKFFNNGFANVYLDETASRYLSLDGKTDIALGIDDRYANYFYLRNSGTVRISKAKTQMSGCNNSLELQTNMVLVANVSKGNPDKLLECLLNAIATSVKEDYEITAATLTNEKVVLSEYSFIGTDRIKSLLMRLGNRTLVKIEFVLYKQINPNSKDCYTCDEKDNNDGGNDGSFIYVSLTSNFSNPFSLPSNIINYPNIKDYTNGEILSFWLDNENYEVSTSAPSNRLISDDNTFKVGALLKIAQGAPAFDGKYLGNQSGMSGTIVGGTYRLNPARMSPYIPDYNPVYNQNTDLPPLNFQLNADTINPVLFTVLNGVITEVVPFPTSGFAYEG